MLLDLRLRFWAAHFCGQQEVPVVNLQDSAEEIKKPHGPWQSWYTNGTSTHKNSCRKARHLILKHPLPQLIMLQLGTWPHAATCEDCPACRHRSPAARSLLQAEHSGSVREALCGMLSWMASPSRACVWLLFCLQYWQL